MASGILKLLGFIAAVAAVWFLYVGLSMDTTVASEAAPPGFEGIANLQLMHFQDLNAVLGIGAAIVSAILFSGGLLIDAIERARHGGSSSEPHEH